MTHRPVRIVTDSVADVPPELAADWQVTVVPLSVQIGGVVYRDRIDLTPEQFYRRLIEERALPQTSVPPPALFETAYRQQLEAGYDVLSIHVSQRVSGTFDVARLAAKDLPADRIRVVDSGLITIAQLLVVRAAALHARAGASLDSVAGLVARLAPRTTFYALLDTLEFLERGGRISRLASTLGSLLSLKPIVSVRGGELVPAGRVRTRAKGLERLVEITLQHQPLDGPLVVAHSNAPEVAEVLRRRLQERCPAAETLVCELGAVVGAHAGPGAVGTGVRWR